MNRRREHFDWGWDREGGWCDFELRPLRVSRHGVELGRVLAFGVELFCLALSWDTFDRFVNIIVFGAWLEWRWKVDY